MAKSKYERKPESTVHKSIIKTKPKRMTLVPNDLLVYPSHGKAVICSNNLSFAIKIKHRPLIKIIENTDYGKTPRKDAFIKAKITTSGAKPFDGYLITRKGIDLLEDIITDKEVLKFITKEMGKCDGLLSLKKLDEKVEAITERNN